MCRSKKFAMAVKGPPVLCVFRGAVLHKTCKSNRVERSALLQALRSHGLASFEQADCIVMESTGVSGGLFRTKKSLSADAPPDTVLLGRPSSFGHGQPIRREFVRRRCTSLRQGTRCMEGRDDGVGYVEDQSKKGTKGKRLTAGFASWTTYNLLTTATFQAYPSCSIPDVQPCRRPGGSILGPDVQAKDNQRSRLAR